MPAVKITCRTNGPLLVSGPVELIDAQGRAFDLAGKETFALCRCGASQNKPFCDGSHKTCGYVSETGVPQM